MEEENEIAQVILARLREHYPDYSININGNEITVGCDAWSSWLTIDKSVVSARSIEYTGFARWVIPIVRRSGDWKVDRMRPTGVADIKILLGDPDAFDRIVSFLDAIGG